MTRECIHGKPFHTCTICKHVKNLLNHNTIIAPENLSRQYGETRRLHPKHRYFW